MQHDFRALARLLGGEISGGQILAPGPGHSSKDRSMCVRLSPAAADGFVVFSHAGDDFAVCRDQVRQKLGLKQEPLKPRSRPEHKAKPLFEPGDNRNATTTADALKLWRAGVDPRGTLVEIYLRSRPRRLELGEDLAGEVLRWHPGVGAILALFRNILTNEPQAISRTFLDREGRKLKRMFLGPVAGCAVKLDADETVLDGLHAGEGVETCMDARQLGFRPTWALGSAAIMAKLPVIPGLEALTLFADHDANAAGERAAREAEARWLQAGREVRIFMGKALGDLNDAFNGA
jgi:hypothetical protein